MFRCWANPKVFGCMLNLYSEKDAVQIALSEKLSGACAPQTGLLFQNVKKGFAVFDI